VDKAQAEKLPASGFVSAASSVPTTLPHKTQPQDLKTIAAAGGRLNPRDVARLRAGAGRDRWMNKPISEIAADMANDDKSDRCTERCALLRSGLWW